MSTHQSIRLLLAVTSPFWRAEEWLSQTSRKDWPQSLLALWSLHRAIDRNGFLKVLSPPQRKQLNLNLASFRPKHSGSLSLSKTKTETLFMLESASLRIADFLADSASWNEKRSWLQRWFNSTSFLTLTESILFSDECIDRILGLQERSIQKKLSTKQLPKTYLEESIYLDLDPVDLYTPYRVLCRWSKTLKLQPGTRVLDLGSGVGRIPITLGLLFPKVEFIGIELMRERHAMAEKARKGLGLRNVRLICGNAAKQGLPPAHYYYLFNPFIGDTLRQVFRQLKNRTRHGKLRVAVAQIELPWSYIKNKIG